MTREPSVIERIFRIVSLLMRVTFYVSAICMIYFGFSLEPKGAIHEIYQLNLIAGGAILFAVTGVWGQVSWSRSDAISNKKRQE